jgi:hypothetical protein
MHTQPYYKVVLYVVISIAMVASIKGWSQHSRSAYLESEKKSESGGKPADTWRPDELVQPEDLAHSLSGAHKPIVLQVGVLRLYQLNHIVGSKYAGQANTPEGVETLKKVAKGMDRASEIVYYCGCCPWKDCPNMKAAHKVLRELGFKNVKALYIPNSFGQDWVTKGLPVEKGGA